MQPCGAAFVPPPPGEVDPLLDDLCAFINDVALPPLVQAAIAHAQFETIHPFEDGNGRTGRALVQVVLRRRGLTPAFVPPISVVLARDKDRYLKGLTLFREDRLADWIELFAPPPPRPPVEQNPPLRTRSSRWRLPAFSRVSANRRATGLGRPRVFST